MANVFKKKLAEQFADGAYSRMINDPDFERNAKFGRMLEDSLYTATYQAYRDRKREEVNANFNLSTQKYPKGANRPKFIFVHALNQIGTVDKKAIIEELRNLVKEFPESDVSELAGMLVKGLESGREVCDPHYQLGSLWERRAEEAEKLSSEAGKEQSLSPERNAPFVCLIAYPTDSLNDDQLLYDIAHFNFTGFMVRNFDLSVSREKDITSLRVKGFNNFDEAHNYAQKLFGDKYLAKVLKHTRVVLISEDNLELLGGRYSYNDYQKFYEQTFAPLKINPDLPLDTEGGPIEQHYEDEYSDEELEEMQNEDGESSSDDDDGEWY